MQLLGLMFCGVRQKVYMTRGIKVIHTLLDCLYIHRHCEREQGKKTKIFQHSITYAWVMTVTIFILFTTCVSANSSRIQGEILLPSYDLLISFQFLWCILMLLHTPIQTNNLYMPGVPQLLLEFHVCISASMLVFYMFVHLSTGTSGHQNGHHIPWS